ncbi:hypothetical protein GCM10009641_82190 [Mycobacterium cookii]
MVLDRVGPCIDEAQGEVQLRDHGDLSFRGHPALHVMSSECKMWSRDRDSYMLVTPSVLPCIADGVISTTCRRLVATALRLGSTGGERARQTSRSLGPDPGRGALPRA